MMEKLSLFLSSYSLWGEAVTAGVVAGAVCGFLGIYVILHRIVFVSAAMSQVSSLGVMIAFYLVQLEFFHTPHENETLAHSHPFEDILPIVLAGSLTALFASAMAGQTQAKISDRSKSAESLIGAAYLLATAGLILIGDRVSQGAHDVSNILFGNAVAVDFPHLLLFLAIALPVFAVHAWLRKDILFTSFDPTMASTLNYPVARLRIFFLISLGVVISVATRTLGALPVFSFSVLPPMAALLLTQDLGKGFYLSAGIGALAAFLGYLSSFLFSFPTGASMTAACGFALLAAKIVSRART